MNVIKVPEAYHFVCLLNQLLKKNTLVLSPVIHTIIASLYLHISNVSSELHQQCGIIVKCF